MLRKISFLVFICIVFIVSVQAQSIAEDDVSIKVIAKFYGAFPGSEMVEWNTVNSEGYLASFLFEGNTVKAWLDARGNLVMQSSEGKGIPETMQTLFDKNYGNYKVKMVKHQMDYQTGLGEYQVVLKTKEHGEFQLKLDQDFVVMENKSGLAYQ